MTARVDFIAYPPTSFPFRDLLVLEQLALGPRDRVCEIGVGSGGTTARLAQMCDTVTGFEISEPTVAALRYLENRHKNLRFVVADVTEAKAVEPFAGAFTKAISCDTLEHVRDPRAYFAALSKVLAPGGEFLVTFPNEPRATMHGITRFDAPEDIAALLTEHGLEGRIGSATLGGRARHIAETLGWGPLRLVRRALRKKSREASAPEDEPQTFDQTNFMKKMDTWKRVSPVVNAYWFGVLKLMAQAGPAFQIDWSPSPASFADCQVVVLGRKTKQDSRTS